MKYNSLVGLCLLIFLVGCEKEPEEIIVQSFPSSILQSLEFDAENCAIEVIGRLSGLLEEDFPSKYGFVYSYDNEMPTIVDNQLLISEDFENWKNFTGVITDVRYGDTIYVRIFANLEGDKYIGNSASSYILESVYPNFINFKPGFSSCGNDEIFSKLVQVRHCFSSGYEYGIIYFNHQNGLSHDEEMNPEGITDGDSTLEFRSSISQQSNGKNAYKHYLMDTSNFVRYESQSYLLPTAQTKSVSKELNDFPGPLRGEAVSFSLGGKGYVCGGYTDSKSSYLGDLWEYTPETDTWEQKADFPGGERAHMVSFTISDQAFVGTGNRETNGIDSVFNDLYRYDPKVDQWTKIADYPIAGNAGLAFTIDSNAYVGGVISATESTISQSFYSYDTKVDQWTKISSFPEEFTNARNSSVVVNGKGYVLSSYDGETEYYEYNPDVDAWSFKQMSTPFDGNDGLAFAKNGKAYQITGRGTALTLELDFESSSFEAMCVDSGVARSEAVGFNIDGSFYIVTGISANRFISSFHGTKRTVYKVDIE